MIIVSPVVRSAVVVALATLTYAAFQCSSSINGSSASGVIMDLPGQVDGFVGTYQEPSEGEKMVLPKDTEIVKKSYTNPTGDVVNTQIVLAGSEKRSIHRPELCLPAQGWSINRRYTMPVKLSDGRAISVMVDVISRPVETSPGVTRSLTSLYCYWFVGKDVSTPSHLMRLLLTSWDRVVHHTNHRWAYVAVSAPVLEGFKERGKNQEETRKMIAEFIVEMGPAVMKR